MSFPEAVLFGIVQGLTEFIPVSSTAHIVILTKLFGVETPSLVFEIFLHFASLLAVLSYFWRDVWWLAAGSCRRVFLRDGAEEVRAAFRFSLLLLVATGVTGVLGTALLSAMGESIRSKEIIATGLFLSAVFLVFVEWGRTIGSRRTEQLRGIDAVVVGLAQTVAVFPGVSRSGATLIGALFLKMSRETAVRFSFLLAIPVLAGSSILALREVGDGALAHLDPFALTLSFLASFVASIGSIAFLIGLLQRKKLYWFACYLVLLTGFVLLYL